jgi:hypothetical protein
MPQLGKPIQTGRKQQPQTDEYDDNLFTFRPATKDGAKARISIQGPSGSGKTWTGLSIASGLARADASPSSTPSGAPRPVRQRPRRPVRRPPDAPLRPPRPAQSARRRGPGRIPGRDGRLPVALLERPEGTLDQVEKAASKYGGNKFAGWKDGGEIQTEMIDALLSYPGHVVVTMRSHTEWVLQENDRGRKEPVAMGMRAEQRKGVEYEFDVVGAMDVSNTLRILKSRCPALHNQILERPDGGTDIAKPLLDWLNDGVAAVDPSAWIDAATADDATPESLLATYREAESHGALATPFLHPTSGEPTNLGDFIKERGTALKNAA